MDPMLNFLVAKLLAGDVKQAWIWSFAGRTNSMQSAQSGRFGPPEKVLDGHVTM